MNTYLGPKTVVTTPGRKPKEVKNLGWLRRNAALVDSIELLPRDDGATVGCILIALLEDGRTYRTAFNSITICRDWIKRRSLKHAKVQWKLKPDAQ